MLISRLFQLRRLMSNQWLSPAELNELQNRKLRTVVKHAYENVPYYHNLFDSVDLKPKDIQTTEDLMKIPITSRTDIQRQSADQIVSRGVDSERCIKLRTSGTTGVPLTVYLTPAEHRFRGLIELRGLLSIGFKPNDRLAFIGPYRKHNARWYQRLGLFRSIKVSPFIDAEQQIQQAKKFKPTILWIYPSHLKILIRSLNERDAKEIEPRLLITSAEVLDKDTYDAVKALWDIEILNFYGCDEFGRIAWECHDHKGLHINMDSVIVEYINDDKTILANERGLTVITSLHSFTMPLLRYRLGDMCTSSDDRCTCGRGFLLLRNLEGREDDFIKLSNGKMVAPPEFYHIMNSIKGIYEFKVIQEEKDKVIVKFTSERRNVSKIASEIKDRFREKLGNVIDVEVEPVEMIEKDYSRKRRVVISRVPINPK